MKYLHPYGSRTGNLDSLTYRTRLDSPKNFEGLFRTHADLVSVTYPRMFGFTKLQDSDSTTQKYLVGHGAELFYLPVGNHGVPKLCTPFAGTVVLIKKNADGKYIISVPRSDPRTNKVLSADEPLNHTHPAVRDDRRTHNLDPLDDEFVPPCEEE